MTDEPESPTGPGDALKTRRPGEAFCDRRIEDYAQARSLGKSIKGARDAAGVGEALAKTWEMSPEVRRRRDELATGSQVTVTVSPAWIIEQLKVNAQRAQEDGKYKDSNDALELLWDLMKTDPAVLTHVAGALPRANASDREAIRRALTAGVVPAEGVEVPR